MRWSRCVALIFGFSLLIGVMFPLAALAQCGQVGPTGGGSVTQYVGDDAPTTHPNLFGIDQVVMKHFDQARSMAARWLAASRLAGARASLHTAAIPRVR